MSGGLVLGRALLSWWEESFGTLRSSSIFEENVIATYLKADNHREHTLVIANFCSANFLVHVLPSQDVFIGKKLSRFREISHEGYFPVIVFWVEAG